jgi:hypothetical protein
MDTTKMLVNIATFSVTNRSGQVRSGQVSSTKKKIDFLKTFLPDFLMTT